MAGTLPSQSMVLHPPPRQSLPGKAPLRHLRAPPAESGSILKVRSVGRVGSPRASGGGQPEPIEDCTLMGL